MVLAQSVERQAQLIGQLDPFEGVRVLIGNRDLRAGERVRVAIAEAVDAEFHGC
jgi:hypothetical protein